MTTINLFLLLLLALCQMPPTILAASSPNHSMLLPTISPVSEARGAPKMQEELLPVLDCVSFFNRILGCGDCEKHGKTCCLGNCVSTNENKCNCGRCGNMCAPFHKCESGRCVSTF